jgi:hypothetical protein
MVSVAIIKFSIPFIFRFTGIFDIISINKVQLEYRNLIINILSG